MDTCAQTPLSVRTWPPPSAHKQPGTGTEKNWLGLSQDEGSGQCIPAPQEGKWSRIREGARLREADGEMGSPGEQVVWERMQMGRVQEIAIWGET